MQYGVKRDEWRDRVWGHLLYAYRSEDVMQEMKPKAFQRGGERERIRFAVGSCSLGAVLVARSERGICAVLLGEDPDALVSDLQDRFRQAELMGGGPEFEDVVAQVAGLVDDPRTGDSLPLDLRGTAFQQRVWAAMRAVPSGTTTTYARLAEAIGMPTASRAVGAAVGANPVAVAIPCHRVIRTDGTIGEYRWGVERKRALMAREAAEGQVDDALLFRATTYFTK